MDLLNYCRQITKTVRDRMAIPNLKKVEAEKCEHALDLCAMSEKFMLPDGGFVIEDRQLRALDYDVELRLPYKLIALEWHQPGAHESGSTRSSKRVLFVREHDAELRCWPWFWIDHWGAWKGFHSFEIPKTGYIQRSPAGDSIVLDGIAEENAADVHAEAERLLGFLNALQCSNVRAERMPARKTGKVKSALPFDEYHVLTIRGSESSAGAANGTHRSPREHLRRGHIRRLQDGRKVWVNATVVCAGRGAGVVSKDYRIAA